MEGEGNEGKRRWSRSMRDEERGREGHRERRGEGGGGGGERRGRLIHYFNLASK